nr:hypothetical protein Iba_chr15aCG4910 [Ipomoea batatas]
MSTSATNLSALYISSIVLIDKSCVTRFNVRPAARLPGGAADAMSPPFTSGFPTANTVSARDGPA